MRTDRGGATAVERHFNEAAKMKRVFVVDDDGEEFDLLARGISKAKGQFEREFVARGEAALRPLATENFEVIISSTRTTDMDGGVLLQTFCERYDGTNPAAKPAGNGTGVAGGPRGASVFAETL